MSILSKPASLFLNDPELICQRDRWFDRLANLFDGREDAFHQQYLFTVKGRVPRPADDSLAYTEPEKWVHACLELLAREKDIPQDRFVPLCVEYPIYGVHFIDKIFGADVFFKDGQWNNRYLTTPIGSLQFPDLDRDETWALARRAAQAFLDADVKLPLFGLPTLSSALNIYINLYGEEGLFAMLDDEEAALHDLTVINDLIRTLHRWYINHIPAQQLQPVISWERTQPPGYGQLCGCTTQLLSGELYDKLVAPLDDALLADYPHGGMIHLCGMHEQHLPVFRKMKHLRALQLNDRAAHRLRDYLDQLREDQVIYVIPCPGMPVEQIVETASDRRVVLIEACGAPERMTGR